MKVYYSDTFELPLPDRHRFPMSKYRLLRERILESRLEGFELRVPEPATDEQLGLVHHREYIERVKTGQLSELEMRRIGFPWSPKMVERSRRSVGASIEAGRAALSEGIAVNLAGGTHHAFPDSGQGYCVFNDVAVAARNLQKERRSEKVLFIDLDVHQGNGTAAVARNDDTLFAFSMHCDRNYPFRKESGDLDIAIPEGTGDTDYLEQLAAALELIENRFSADMAFYLAGADPFEGDRLGLLRLTREGLACRDQIVFDWCSKNGLPCAISMAGGYAVHVPDIVDIHFSTVAAALTVFKSRVTAG
jgi:acetoin utilization deacetylase AcuC-like enzyme